MRRIRLIVVLATVWLGTSATTLQAQWGAGYHHHYPGYYDGYGYGVALIYDLGGGWHGRHYAAQSRLLGEQIAAQQSAAMQRSIRHAMSAEAERRSDQIYGQQQADRDWWLQVQQQQIADRQQVAQLAAMTAGVRAASAPKAATDVIKWPPLLHAPQFAEQRAQIETPYRRNSKGPITPTAADYQNMIQATERMRSIVKELTANLTAQEYLDSQAFLDRLAAEARNRLEKATPKK
jgi:hypothetical protein